MVTVRVVQVVTDEIIDMVAVRHLLMAAIGAVVVPVIVVVAGVIRRAVGRVAFADRYRVALDAVALVTV
jgi:hypothetical protein